MKTIKEMPDEFLLDDVVERLLVLNKINFALLEIKQGKGLTTILAKRKLQKWVKKIE